MKLLLEAVQNAPPDATAVIVPLNELRALLVTYLLHADELDKSTLPKLPIHVDIIDGIPHVAINGLPVLVKGSLIANHIYDLFEMFSIRYEIKLNTGEIQWPK